MKEYPNLIPNKERSPSELREMGRKGGIKSGEVRRKKRDIKKAAAVWVQVFDELEKQGISMEEITDKLMEILGK